MPAPTDPSAERDKLSRRNFLKSAGGIAAGGAIAGNLAAEPEPEPAPEAAEASVRTYRGEVEIELSLNGEKKKVKVEPRTTLLSALRHRVEPPLTGTKEVCSQGNCGACTVMVNGRPSYSCLLLAVDCIGKEVRTVEGLGDPDNLSPVQEAFWKHDASMCGFCTPGFVVATTACLERNPSADLGEIKERISGNLCRCGTYPHIFDAAQTAGRQMKGGEGR